MMKQRIQSDLKEAMKSGKHAEVSTLRMLLAALVNKEKERGEEVGEEEAQDIVRREIKKRKQALEAFGRAGRTESAEKEKREMEILQNYVSE